MRLLAVCFGIFILIGLNGCATLKPNASKIMILTTEPDTSKYEYLGDMTASSNHAMGLGKSVESVRIKFKNKAAEMGADIVIIDTNNQLGSSVTMSGRAFKKK